MVDCPKALPQWARLEVVGLTDNDRPIYLLVIGKQDSHIDQRPGFWLDGGTHAAEWTSVMSALYSVSDWLSKLAAGDALETAFFESHTAYVMPCISPDGYAAMMDGSPFIRSTLRPPPNASVQVGFVPEDLTGDKTVRWMRWKHPAGAFVIDQDNPFFMRPRTLDDPADAAYFFCQEGSFVNWDGHSWVRAHRQFGLDLNRNFPAHWAPFSMFGMDGGTYPLSAPESRALVDTFARYPHIGAAVTNHTYTGCVLTQPYRKDTPLPRADIQIMERIAKDAVRGTDYRVYKTYPDFTYDPDTSIVGVWADTISTTFGIPGYTLELWDPFGYAGIDHDKPAEFFSFPNPEMIAQVIKRFAERGDTTEPWAQIEHPQLGQVDVGGLDYMRTIRNPPVPLLEAECKRGTLVADRVRRCLPRVESTLKVVRRGPSLYEIQLTLANLGFLSTSSLAHGVDLPSTPVVQAELTLPDTAGLVSGQPVRQTTHLDGWGSFAPGGVHSVYPSLPERGHQARLSWLVDGDGTISIAWIAGRGGRGQVTAHLG